MRPPAREETPCALCGRIEVVVVGARDRDGRPLRTVLCRFCGLVWTSPRPTAADMHAYYERAYREDYKGHRTPPLRKIVRGFVGAAHRRRTLRELLRRRTAIGDPPAATRQARMIDVGCGAGELVYLMRRDGVDASGVEPGAEFADFARTVLDVPIECASVESAHVPAASQDLATLFHALEHVPDPRRVLEIVRGWMSAGAYLVVEVPNVAACVQAPAHRFHYAHLYHFTGATLTALGEAVGLAAVETRLSPDGGNVTAVFRRDRDEPREPAALESEASRLQRILSSHTTLRHYATPIPYRRALARLRQRLAEDRLLRRMRTVEDAVRWADRL